MNLQDLFQAVKNDRDLPILFVVVAELERQGYTVTVNDRLANLRAVKNAEEKGELTLIPSRNGFKMTIEKKGERQTFRVQILDVGVICLTDSDTGPVIFDERFKTGFFKPGDAHRNKPR
jgi:hypothetical protein